MLTHKVSEHRRRAGSTNWAEMGKHTAQGVRRENGDEEKENIILNFIVFFTSWVDMSL